MGITSAFSARNSRASITVGSQDYFLFARKWTIGIKVDELDVTTFEELGFADYEDGIMEGDVSFDGFWDARMHAVGLAVSLEASDLNPPVLFPGMSVEAEFYVKGADDIGADGTTANPVVASGIEKIGGAPDWPFYYFPNLLLCSCSVDAMTRSTLDINFSAKAQGAFYTPGQLTSITNPRGVWY